MRDFEKEKMAAIMGIVCRTAEPEWKHGVRAEHIDIVPVDTTPHPAGEGIFEHAWATALVKFAAGLVGNEGLKEIANAQLREAKPILWPKSPKQ